MKLHSPLMRVVGLRELKNRLSEYIRDVRRGERVLVSDRGQIVAELSPPGGTAPETGIPDGLQELARQGLARPGRPNDRRAYRAHSRALAPGRAAALLGDQRGPR
jgi:antitoxin (DNA-binding transcriptional repressor) of toxin-antitoxin stability system